MALLDLVDVAARRLARTARKAHRRWAGTGVRTDGALPLVYWTPRQLPQGTPTPAPHQLAATRAIAAIAPARRRGRLMAIIGAVITIVGVAVWFRTAPTSEPATQSGHQSSNPAGEERGYKQAIDRRSLGELPIAIDSAVDRSSDVALEPIDGTELAWPPIGSALLLKEVRPVYPAAARAAGVEGLVIVTYSLDAHGRPRDLKVTKSVPMLDGAAIAALRQWEYTPPPPGSTQLYRFNAEFVLDGIAQ